MRLSLHLALLAFLGPYLVSLWMYWSGPAKGAASSALALVAGAWFLLRRPRAAAGGGSPVTAQPLGLVLMALAVLVHLGAGASDFRLGLGLSAVLLVAALYVVLEGVATLRTRALSWVLLCFSVPVPGAIADWANVRLIDGAAAVALPLLGFLVGPIESQGYVLQFEGGRVSIVEDCSGLSGILLFLPLALLFLHLRPPASRLAGGLVFASALPLAWLGNLLRILITVLLLHWGVEASTDPFLHELVGIVSLALPLLVLLVLSRLPRPREGA